ncbi:hypothetical protein ACIBG8_31950 [Nonomuraea sp. NPDC050556]|uniref:hypothetical protein n=1 Tax=Nonomuraea sp. NPDC050556 TaxID=3364369 RepID=UPI00379E4324
MRFEEQILMEMQTEIVARNARGRRRRVLAMGATVAGLAAVAAIGVPLLTGTESPAYAVSKGADGTVRVLINEFRDADRLERDLAKVGITADVSYLKPGTRCDFDRGELAGGKDSMLQDNYRSSVHAKVMRGRDRGFDINPEYLGKGQTLVLEFSENDDQSTGKPKVLYSFSARVVVGKVKPCKVIADPSWYDVGGPEGQPPAGS